MKVYKCGTKVYLNEKIEALITRVQIRGDVLYEVSYFKEGGDYCSVWLSEFEFSTKSKAKEEIGFK